MLGLGAKGLNDGLFDGPLPSRHSLAYEGMYRPSGDHFRVLSKARAHCEDLWIDFQEFADPNFRAEFAYRTHERWFEMYLTVSLIRAGHKVICRKPGPDILLKEDGRRIWIEATCATRVACRDAPIRFLARRLAGFAENQPTSTSLESGTRLTRSKGSTGNTWRVVSS